MIVFGDEFEDVIKFNYTTPQRKQPIQNADHSLNKNRGGSNCIFELYIKTVFVFLLRKKKSVELLSIYIFLYHLHTIFRT